MSYAAIVDRLTDAAPYGVALLFASLVGSVIRLIVVLVAYERAAARGYPTDALTEIVRIAISNRGIKREVRDRPKTD